METRLDYLLTFFSRFATYVCMICNYLLLYIYVPVRISIAFWFRYVWVPLLLFFFCFFWFRGGTPFDSSSESVFPKKGKKEILNTLLLYSMIHICKVLHIHQSNIIDIIGNEHIYIYFTPPRLHPSFETHWVWSGGLLDPSHKVICCGSSSSSSTYDT